ncbi:MAG: UDP-N-acetylmuramoyl-tripeptide--D-alanyl-D-alanine ligase [Saprospiraceae bacterium]|nr:MAG: UDP-N-acetylmuramoyl-tripeptide--D-alanyl-D-alanine ligase [Saprospiraceae bacterium]
MKSIEDIYALFQKHPHAVTDSREIVPGCLFFALKGKNFDGNAFAMQSLENGAAFAVADDPAVQLDERIILVDNALSTLQRLATCHRQQFDIPVLAITGTNGKTTTKDLVSTVLSSHFQTHCTKGNFNNHIGVPLTLLSMPPATKIAVVEMGANHPGEIDMLCQIARPTHGLVTNVGKAHLEGFGSFDGVKKAKAELYRYLATQGGTAFVNTDEPWLPELAASITKKLFYHRSEAPAMGHIPIEVKLVTTHPFLEVTFLSPAGELITVRTKLAGDYNFNNLMTAIAVGKYFKVPAQKIKTALEKYQPVNNRSQLITVGTNSFLLDAYNANPASMRLALSSFANMASPHKIVILGAMRELGAFSEVEHEAIAAFALSPGFEQVIFVGQEFEAAARKRSLPHFKTTAALRDWFDKKQFAGKFFLVKGSRSIGLEKLLEPPSQTS